MNNSKISENKVLYERKKTPMRSFAKVDHESKSTLKNREELLKKNLSKPKSRNNSNTRNNNPYNQNPNMKTLKSNSSIRVINKSLKPERCVSEDQNKSGIHINIVLSKLIKLINFDLFIIGGIYKFY